MSEDDSVKHEGKWTQADLPDGYDLVRAKGGIVQPFFFDTILDVIVDHLNTHYPKPDPEDATPRVVWRERALEAERYLVEARRERDAAIARADPAVTRADIEEQLRIAYESGNHPIQRIRVATDAMCNLFGIEAEPTVDPIEEKAIAAFKVAWHEADMHGDEGNRTRRGIRAARKVIEGDRK